MRAVRPLPPNTVVSYSTVLEKTIMLPFRYPKGFIQISSVVWSCLFFMFHFVVLNSTTTQQIETIQREFAQLPKPVGIDPVEVDMERKSEFAIVSAKYASFSLNLADIVALYESRLEEQAWTLIESQTSTDPTVGYIRVYCRGQYTFHVEYSGWDGVPHLATWLHWGILDSCGYARRNGLLLLSPDFAVLGLGMCAIWIVHGMRQRQNASSGDPQPPKILGVGWIVGGAVGVCGALILIAINWIP